MEEASGDRAVSLRVSSARFLPLPRPELLAPLDRLGPVTLYAARGTPVHAVDAGRVVSVDVELGGEIVTAIGADRFHRYRRLHPTSIQHRVGDWIDAGTIIGQVGDAADERNKPPCLVLGLLGEDGAWLDMYSTLIGLPDPCELGFSLQDRSKTNAVPPAAPAVSRGHALDQANRPVSTDDVPSDDALAALVARPRRGPT